MIALAVFPVSFSLSFGTRYLSHTYCAYVTWLIRRCQYKLMLEFTVSQISFELLLRLVAIINCLISSAIQLVPHGAKEAVRTEIALKVQCKDGGEPCRQADPGTTPMVHDLDRLCGYIIDLLCAAIYIVKFDCPNVFAEKPPECMFINFRSRHHTSRKMIGVCNI